MCSPARLASFAEPELGTAQPQLVSPFSAVTVGG
jgi:hypothetical protein